jgi:transposase
LEKLQQINEPIYQVYLLKEQFYKIYNLDNKNDAKMQMLSWIETVQKTHFEHLKKFADTLINHLRWIMTYFKHGTTSSKIEGVNNKIKVIKRLAYGYTDLDYFFKKIRSKFCNIPRFFLLYSTV